MREKHSLAVVLFFTCSRLKAKFHYGSWFGDGSEPVRSWFGACSEPTPN